MLYVPYASQLILFAVENLAQNAIELLLLAMIAILHPFSGVQLCYRLVDGQ